MNNLLDKSSSNLCFGTMYRMQYELKWSVNAPCLHHGLLATSAYLLDSSVFHLIYALVKRILRELGLTSRNHLSTTSLNLSIAVIHYIDVWCAHVDCLWSCEDAALVSLTQRAESLLERTHLGQHRSTVGSQKWRVNGWKEELNLAEWRERRLGHQ